MTNYYLAKYILLTRYIHAENTYLKGISMNLISGFRSKEALAKKLAKRNAERISDYTLVSSAFKPEDVKIINDNLDSIARFAERKNINLRFEPSSADMSSAKMKVYKRGVTLMNDVLGDPSWAVPVENYRGSAKLPAGIESKEDLMEAIKKSAAEILYKK